MSTFEIILEFVNEKLWLAILIVPLYFRACPRKKLFGRKAILGIVGVFVLGLLPRLLIEQFPQLSLVSFWLTREQFIWPVLMTFYLGLMFQGSWNMNLFTALAGLCTQEIMYGIWAVISIKAPIVATNLGELLICICIGSGLTISLYYFIGVRLTPRSLQTLRKRSLIPLILLYLVSALLLWYSTSVVLFLILFYDTVQGALEQAGSSFGITGVRMAAIYTGIAADLMVLFALRNMLRYSESDLEKELLEQIREQDRKQYTRFRSNVDYINTKSHDLRHYLELLRSSEKLPEQELRQVSESLLNLDSETDSGNETLDLILTDRRLSCESMGIELIFQTDGTRLAQLDTIDTYTLFCNILDNAVEYVRALPEEKRQIRLGIRTIHSMVFIHQENPLSGTLEIRNGLPVTTHDDTTLHGFGLKSVQDTVKKRGGELMIRAEGDRFELDICFPEFE